MKQKLFGRLAAAAVLLLGAASASAHDFEVDGIFYNKEDWNKTASVTYKGDSEYAYSNEYSGAVTIPSEVTYEGTTYSVTAIGTSAFRDCSGLTSVEIPNSVTEIGFYAFSYCSGLTSVEIPNSVTSIGCEAFSYCRSLTSVEIPNSVTYIGNRAFYGCNSLASVVIPNSVTSICESAFYGCSSLTAVSIGDSVTEIGYQAFYGCSILKSVEIPNSVTSIGNYAFQSCSSLESITVKSGNTVYDSRDNCNALIETATNTLLCGCKNTIIPNSVIEIGSSAFSNCSGLTSVAIPNSVTKIGSYAFYGCSGLTSVAIPNSITTIGECSFSGCSGLTSVEIPNSVTSIGVGAFDGCSSLTSVEVPNSVTSIGEYTFDGCSGLTSVGISNSVTTIGYAAFRNCSSLKSVEIPTSVTKIGNSAFSGCSGLTTVAIPNSVTEIGQFVFSGCSGLKSVVIPNSVTEIGLQAFDGCSGLTSVVIPNSVSSIGDSAFSGCSNLKLVFYNATNSTSSGIVFDTWYCTFVIGENVTKLPDNLYYSWQSCTVVSHADVPPVISANTFGSATVYVSSAAYPDYFIDDVWGNMTIRRIETPVASIALNVEDTQIGTNGSSQLTATITPADATMKTLYWSSDNPKVARVDQNGKVQGLSNGVATITAMAIDGSGVVATCHVTVGEIIAETLELDPAEITIAPYASAVITPIYTPTGISNTNFEWTSSNEGVARFKKNDNGTITVLGIADGEAIITCHTTDGSDLTATCTVTVGTGTGVEGVSSTAAKVRGENGMIRVEGAEDARVEVFNTAGVCIYSGTDTEIYVPQRGLYVVKVAGIATKLAL